VYYPVPGCGAGHLAMECNPASYFDQMLIPGRLYKTIHDPEGLLSTIPAISTGLLGIFAGEVLRMGGGAITKTKKALLLSIGGVLCIALALIWGTVFPINKNLWSSSFTLMAGGWSLLVLALFYIIVDILEWRRWTLFFVVIGMNSIVIYMAWRFINFEYTAKALFGGILSYFPGPIEAVGHVIAFLAVQWTFMYILYKNKLFLKV
jgi:predicted acyltransferase